MSEFAFPASLSTGGPVATVTAFNAGAESPVYMADENHPHWDAILDGLRRGDSRVWNLFDIVGGVMQRFQQVTDRVSWDGENVLWDGDVMHSVLADQLSRALSDGNAENYTALAKFWEKLESNPSAHSREQAYKFLATHAFQITPDGDVVGYKGMHKQYDSEDGATVYRSSWASTVPDKPSAFVNGRPIQPLSTVPQTVGDVVTMPRSEVVHDPSQACMRGLHVATRSYASGYGTVMEVHFNPRDIVSVPNDARGEKVRVCRYVNSRLAVPETKGPVLRSGDRPVWAGDVGYRV